MGAMWTTLWTTFAPPHPSGTQVGFIWAKGALHNSISTLRLSKFSPLSYMEWGDCAINSIHGGVLGYIADSNTWTSIWRDGGQVPGPYHRLRLGDIFVFQTLCNLKLKKKSFTILSEVMILGNAISCSLRGIFIKTFLGRLCPTSGGALL